MRDFERWLKGLWSWGVSLYWSSMKGTWMEGPLAGDPGGWVEKALEKGIDFRRSCVGEPGRGLIYRGL
jgi:hypothetical protein